MAIGLRIEHTRTGHDEQLANPRPIRSLGQAAPRQPLPQRTRTKINGIRRRDRLDGLLHEYLHCRMRYTGFRAPTGGMTTWFRVLPDER
jgi:hypothetical protein